MEKQEKVKISCDQLKGLFDSLNKNTNYREEIINDYHKIITNLTGQLTLNNLEDYRVPASALNEGYSPFEEKYYDGGIVRSKVKQLIAVLESEYQILENRSKNNNTTILKSNEEITLSLLIKKEFNNFFKNIHKYIQKVEENLVVKIIIIIGAIGGGLILIINFLK